MKKTPLAFGMLALALFSNCKKDSNTSTSSSDDGVVATADKMFGPQTALMQPPP